MAEITEILYLLSARDAATGVFRSVATSLGDLANAARATHTTLGDISLASSDVSSAFARMETAQKRFVEQQSLMQRGLVSSAADIKFYVDAQNRAAAAADKHAESLRNLQRVQASYKPEQSALGALASGVGSVAGGLAVGAIAGTALYGMASINTYNQFQQTEQTAAAQTGVSPATIAEFGRQILQFTGSGQTPYTPTQLVENAQPIFSMGVRDPSRAADIAKVASKFSQSGNLADTSQAAELIKMIGDTFGSHQNMTGPEAEKYFNEILAARQIGGASLSDLTNQLPKFASIGQAAGFSLEDLLAMFSRASQTIPGQAIGGQLRSLGLNVLRPNQKQRDSAEAYGVDLSPQGVTQAGGGVAWLRDVFAKTGGVGITDRGAQQQQAQILATFFNRPDLSMLMAVAGQGGRFLGEGANQLGGGLARIRADAAVGPGDLTNRAAGIAAVAYDQQLKEQQSRISTEMNAAGEALAPLSVAATKLVADTLQVTSTWIPNIVKALGFFGNALDMSSQGWNEAATAANLPKHLSDLAKAMGDLTAGLGNLLGGLPNLPGNVGGALGHDIGQLGNLLNGPDAPPSAPRPPASADTAPPQYLAGGRGVRAPNPAYADWQARHPATPTGPVLGPTLPVFGPPAPASSTPAATAPVFGPPAPTRPAGPPAPTGPVYGPPAPPPVYGPPAPIPPPPPVYGPPAPTPFPLNTHGPIANYYMVDAPPAVPDGRAGLDANAQRRALGADAQQQVFQAGLAQTFSYTSGRLARQLTDAQGHIGYLQSINAPDTQLKHAQAAFDALIAEAPPTVGAAGVRARARHVDEQDTRFMHTRQVGSDQQDVRTAELALRAAELNHATAPQMQAALGHYVQQQTTLINAQYGTKPSSDRTDALQQLESNRQIKQASIDAVANKPIADQDRNLQRELQIIQMRHGTIAEQQAALDKEIAFQTAHAAKLTLSPQDIAINKLAGQAAVDNNALADRKALEDRHLQAMSTEMSVLQYAGNNTKAEQALLNARIAYETRTAKDRGLSPEDIAQEHTLGTLEIARRGAQAGLSNLTDQAALAQVNNPDDFAAQRRALATQTAYQTANQQALGLTPTRIALNQATGAAAINTGEAQAHLANLQTEMAVVQLRQNSWAQQRQLLNEEIAYESAHAKDLHRTPAQIDLERRTGVAAIDRGQAEATRTNLSTELQIVQLRRGSTAEQLNILNQQIAYERLHAANLQLTQQQIDLEAAQQKQAILSAGASKAEQHLDLKLQYDQRMGLPTDTDKKNIINQMKKDQGVLDTDPYAIKLKQLDLQGTPAVPTPAPTFAAVPYDQGVSATRGGADIRFGTYQTSAQNEALVLARQQVYLLEQQVASLQQVIAALRAGRGEATSAASGTASAGGFVGRHNRAGAGSTRGFMVS